MSEFLTHEFGKAKKLSEAQGWSEQEEIDGRDAWYSDQCKASLVDRAASDSTYLRLVNVTEDPHAMCPRSFATFWAMLSRAKVRFLRSEPIHNCPLHDNAPHYRDTLMRLKQELAKAEEPQNPTEAQSVKITKLQGHLSRKLKTT